MTEKRCYLVDANVIVHAYEIQVWGNLLAEAKIITAGSIVQDEAKFYSREQKKVMIDLPQLVERGKLDEVDPSIHQIKKLSEKFDDFFVERIHEGERDILAHLLDSEDEESAFCSADRVALKALAMLGLGDLGISLEEILEIIGYQKGNLDREYTKAYLEGCLEEGRQNRITGLGLADSK